MALTTVYRILRDTPTVVLGSAPLSGEARSFIASTSPVSSRLVCINGSVSSTERSPDIWVMNSRDYDDEFYSDPIRWSAERKQLHEIMLSQGSHRHTRHMIFLQKGKYPGQTFARLKDQGTRWRGETFLHPGLKTDLVRKAGVRRFQTAFNISAGLFGLCVALLSKTPQVTLLGFSFSDGHAYLSTPVPNTRFHIPQDQEALSDLTRKHGERFRIIY